MRAVLWLIALACASAGVGGAVPPKHRFSDLAQRETLYWAGSTVSVSAAVSGVHAVRNSALFNVSSDGSAKLVAGIHSNWHFDCASPAAPAARRRV